MKQDLPLLIDAICEAHAMALGDGRFVPKYSKDLGRVITHCNESVNYIARKFGYSEFNKPGSIDPFDAKLANEQHSIMELSADWKAEDSIDAQKFANEGALVVGSISNADGPGHVIVIRPGNCKFSNSWDQMAPKCLNIGSAVFLDKKASWAFRSVPRFFVLVK